MYARLKFTSRSYFNFQNRILCMPGVLLGGSARQCQLWSIVFRAEKQVNELEYLGDVAWLVDPREEGFEPGLTFDVVSNPIEYSESGYVEGVIAKGELLG